jgi:murein DD-endopeptidase MepM/ murein hydrolase activator NlpD
VKPRRYILAGAVALALTAAGSAAAAARAQLAQLQPVPAALAGEVQAIADDAVREASQRPAFPVAGEFNWGQGGAQFGASRGGRSHEGQDVFARTGAPLVSVRRGVVVETGNDGGRGNYVAIFSPDTRRTYVYLHMNEPSRVGKGRNVAAGQRIGAVGCTGSCFGDHLHFEIRRGRGPEGPAEDPEPALRRWADADGARATLPPGAQ